MENGRFLFLFIYFYGKRKEIKREIFIYDNMQYVLKNVLKVW